MLNQKIIAYPGQLTPKVTYYSYTVFFKNGKPFETVHHENCKLITGYTPHEFIKDHYLWIKMVPEYQQDYVREQVEYALVQAENHEYEHQIIDKHGEIKDIKKIIIINKDMAGNLISYTGLAIDITAEKAGQKAIQEKAEDMIIAATLQRAYLPKLEDFKNYAPLDIYFHYQPLFDVGGDIISINLLGDNKVSVFIADVTGHGVAAGMLTGVVKSVSEEARAKYPYQPAMQLKYFNEIIVRKFYSIEQFLTGLYGFFEPLENNQIRFTWAKGGHPSPLLYRKQEDRFSHLKSKGKLMGLYEGQEFEEKSIILHQGDRLFLYTDGISETQNNNSMIMDFEGSWEVFFSNLRNESIKRTVKKVLARLAQARSGPAEDDIILAGFEVR